MARDLGDFQTPPALVTAVLDALSFANEAWPRVLEPTCGRGNFIAALLKAPVPPREIKAVELQGSHLKTAQKMVERLSPERASFYKANVFDLDLGKLRWRESGPLLVIGNPPWVTNAELGVLESANLPRKTNLKSLRGIEAMTGASNFDVAEYIWLKLIKELAHEQPTIALLCKTSVARKVLQFASDAALPITDACIRKIDAKKWFGAAVEACLFCVKVGAGERRYQAEIYPDLHATEPDSAIGFFRNGPVADVRAYERVAFIDGACPSTWRQGLKHDASSIMEITQDSWGKFWNKRGEAVSVEPDFVFPLLKGTDLFHGKSAGMRRAVIVTQRHLGEDTRQLERSAPRLWEYLTAYGDIFEKRKSSIYRRQPPFAMFGIGSYSFAHYKVAISGLHKLPRFRAIGPANERPVMLDDTSYFIACSSPEQAAFLAALLNAPISLDFLRSVAFMDSKRPVTKKLLQRMNLGALLDRADAEALLSQAEVELQRMGTWDRRPTWPPILKDLLTELSLQNEVQMTFKL